MVTRIRYSSVGQEGGNLVSKPIQGGSEGYVVTLFTSNNSFNINTLTGGRVATGTATTLTKLKALAKAELKNLGVVFHDEVRLTEGKISGSVSNENEFGIDDRTDEELEADEVTVA